MPCAKIFHLHLSLSGRRWESAPSFIKQTSASWRPFLGKAYFRRSRQPKPTVGARGRMLISFLPPPSLPLFPFHPRMDGCVCSIHFYDIRTSATGFIILHTVASLQQGKPSLLFVSVFGREEANGWSRFRLLLLLFRPLASPRGVGLRVCAFRSRMNP
jgi:hypothetical protein